MRKSAAEGHFRTPKLTAQEFARTTLVFLMERASEILRRAMRRFDRPEAALAWLSSAWPAIVGESLAMHARPLRCAHGCLELTADGKAWQQQIESMQRELFIRVNQAWGANLVRELRFLPDHRGEKRPPRAVDNSHTPFIRRQRS